MILPEKICADEVAAAKHLLDSCRSVVIVTHVSPDGDAIGSSLAMREYLRARGKSAVVVVPNYFPDFLRWMKDADLIIQFDRRRLTAQPFIDRADLIICLDFNALSRIEALGQAVQESKARRLLIDHHLNPEPFCDVSLSYPTASSTCELVFRLFDAIGALPLLSREAAEDIYTGMCTDTGKFSYCSNDPDLYLILAELLRKGIDKDLINRRIYNNYTEARFRLLGYILSEKLVVYPELHASLFTLDRAELKRFHYLKGDTEGVVNLPLQIKGQKLSIFMHEDTEQPRICVSLRSVDDFPVNRMAADFFNGGGHINAAGGKLYCTMDEAVRMVEQALEAYRELLTA